MLGRFLEKWYNYIFKRNPFVNQVEEKKYVIKILCMLYMDYLRPDISYENWLLRVVPKRNCVYVEMKSRGCGYIFGPGWQKR